MQATVKCCLVHTRNCYVYEPLPAAATATATAAERGQLFECRVHLQFVQGKTIKVS